jgi:hypothetical protein
MFVNINQQHGNYPKSVFMFRFDGDNWWTIEERYVKLIKHFYIFYMDQIFQMLAISNTTTVWNVEVVLGKLKTVEMRASARKWLNTFQKSQIIIQSVLTSACKQHYIT